LFLKNTPPAAAAALPREENEDQEESDENDRSAFWKTRNAFREEEEEEEAGISFTPTPTKVFLYLSFVEEKLCFFLHKKEERRDEKSLSSGVCKKQHREEKADE